jgi:hypothetical protein
VRLEARIPFPPSHSHMAFKIGKNIFLPSFLSIF